MTLGLHELPQEIRDAMDKTKDFLLTKESVAIPSCPQCGGSTSEREVESPPGYEGKSLIVECNTCDWSDAFL